MQGIAAISANNGWAMALAGACIVMSGLAILSFVISQLHKMIAIFEKKEKQADASEKEPAHHQTELPTAEFDILNDLPTAARIYKSLTNDLGDSFSLPTLHRIFVKENLPHPHLTISALRDAGFLVPAGDGNFSWKNV